MLGPVLCQRCTSVIIGPTHWVENKAYCGRCYGVAELVATLRAVCLTADRDYQEALRILDHSA